MTADRTPGLMMVTAPMINRAIADMPNAARLRNGVEVTRAQLETAAKILRDGPQPEVTKINGRRVADGKSDMPGFIDAAENTGRSLILQVGILPSRHYRIDRVGRAREVSA